jgi:hypothetical protein
MTTILSIIILFTLLVILGVIIYVFTLLKSRFTQINYSIANQGKSLHKTIRDVVEPKFLDITPSSSNLIELATEVWRVEKRTTKVSESLSDEQNKAFENSVTKLKRFLDKNDITFTDYTDQKYNEGLNLDVLSIEKDESISDSIIKETHEPAIFHKGQLIKKAKVVILEK